MKHAIIIVAILSIAAVGQTETSSLRVEEVFSVETSEELEASLTDGYPMPWLAAILEDETIPEEDRYWLDCRVRAVIAQDLHLFYDREGNPVHIEADMIKPGENFWRENFIIDPPGSVFDYESSDLPSGMTSQPGYVVNRFGEKIGEIAMTHERIRLSRDASLGIYRSESTGITANNACLLYLDGSFTEIPIDPVFLQFAVSDDGSMAVYYSRLTRDLEGSERRLYAFDHEGNTIYENIMPYPHLSSDCAPLISPDTKYIALAMRAGEVRLLNASDGKTIHIWENLTGNYMYFPPDSRHLCVSGVRGAYIFECESGRAVFEHSAPPNTATRQETYDALSCSNNLATSFYTTKVRVLDERTYSGVCLDRNGSVIYTFPSWSRFLPSPSGAILLDSSIDIWRFGRSRNGSSTPFSVLLTREVR
ncbi:MAG: hypothetical protein KAR40_17135 [Candidatus Sabulitectum sp.]|nr:hypothetical protein [Candidatus Sabulitectum sp.]